MSQGFSKIVQNLKREKKFSHEIYKVLHSALPDHKVVEGDNVLYRIIIDPDGRLQPKNPTDGSKKRGHSFETDILIKKKTDGVPLVIMELKSGGFSTHDILVYSAKASRHKAIYPYLRYGLLVEQKKPIDRKFFIHNTVFDFAFMVKNLKDDREKLIELAHRQVGDAEKLAEAVVKKASKQLYESSVNLE